MRHLVPAVALLLAPLALAQPDLSQVGLSLRGGANVTWISGEHQSADYDVSSCIGHVVGGGVDVPVRGPRLRLSVGALYSEKGERVRRVGGVPEYETQFAGLGAPGCSPSRAYVEVPLALVALLPVGPADLRLQAGGFVSSGTILVWPLSEAADYGVLAGVGLGRGAFTLDARAEVGFEGAGGGFRWGPGRATRAVSITLGYRLTRPPR